MIDINTKNALFYEMHKAMEESSMDAVDTLGRLASSDLNYPPGVELTASELAALKGLTLSVDARSALKKVIKDACAYPLFNLFCLLDSVSDPEDIDPWRGLSLCEKQDEDDEFMHDEFGGSFHAYYTKK